MEFMKAVPVVGTVLRVMGAVGAGQAKGAAADFQAAQLEQQAGQSRASAQSAAIEQRRQGRLKLSALQARAGGGAMDESLVSLAGDIAGDADYRARVALFDGESKAGQSELSAAVKRFEGGQSRIAGYVDGVTSVFGGKHAAEAKTADPAPAAKKPGEAGIGVLADPLRDPPSWATKPKLPTVKKR